MRYCLFLAGTGFVSVLSFATYDAARAAYDTAVSLSAFGRCAAVEVVLMTSAGRIISVMS